MHLEYVWLGLLVVFLTLEGVTISLVSLWFAFGSLAALIVCLLGGPLWLQTTLFLAISGLTLTLLRPVVRKHFTPKLTPTNVDAVLGSVGTVIEEIDNIQAAGQVKLGAAQWSARSSSQQPIPAGTLVRVDRVEGVKVFVSPVPQKSKTTVS